MEFAKDIAVPEHSHEAQWGTVLAGEIELIIEGGKFILHSGDTYFIPASAKHSAIIKAGYKDTTLFNQKDRYTVESTDEKNSTQYLTTPVYVTTITSMEWEESKRQKNLRKHGLDFSKADYVLESPFRLDVTTIRNNENRTQSFAYVFDCLAVLSVVHIKSGTRIISFRRASREEREVYHEWLADELE